MRYLLLLALCLCGCQTAERRAELKAQRIAALDAEWQKNYTPLTIKIHSVPSGAIIDYNGDHVGTTPCELHLPKAWRGSWPANGNILQTLRARWLDGMVWSEFYPINSTPPKTVLFMHPNATDYLQSPAPPTLSQR